MLRQGLGGSSVQRHTFSSAAAASTAASSRQVNHRRHCSTHTCCTHPIGQSQGFQPHCSSLRQPEPSRRPVNWLHVAALTLVQLHMVCAGHAADLIESNVTNEGNIPSELSAEGETVGPKLSSLMAGANRKQIETCTRTCVPTCTRGGEGAPGLGPISMRKEIMVFKNGFRSRQYCLSECAQVCSLMINKPQASSSTSSAAARQLQQPVTAAALQQQEQQQPDCLQEEQQQPTAAPTAAATAALLTP